MKYPFDSKLFFLLFLFIAYQSFAQSQTLKPGDISPNAKYVDAVELRQFNLGAALISKGITTLSGATALIDKNGDFIVPYNKYQITGEFNNKFENSKRVSVVNTGLFQVIDNQRGVLLNAKGQLLGQKSIGNLALTPDGKYLWEFTGTNRGVLLVDADNNEKDVPALIDANLGFYNCGLAPFTVKSTGKYGYKDINGKIVVQPQYDITVKFSDGMALVGANDQNSGGIKYGYIDSTGKLAIPLMYSIKPTDFYGGTAIVYPKTGADFAWALIDKKGDIVKKYGVYDPTFSAADYFHNMRYDARNHYLLGRNGQILNDMDLLALLGIKPLPKIETDELINIDAGDGKIYYKRMILTPQRTTQIITGYVDINTNKKMEGPFQEGFYFDKVSGLAHAKMVVGKNKVGYPVVRDGYINEDGIFVMVKKEQSEF